MIAKNEEEIVQVNFRVPRGDIAKFDEVARERRTSRSGLLREVILRASRAGGNDE